MNKNFDQAKDKNVASYIAYGKTADSKLYAEETYKTQLEEAEVKDAFMKGRLLIVNGADTFVPVKMTANKVLTLSMATNTLAGKEWEAKAAE